MPHPAYRMDLLYTRLHPPPIKNKWMVRFHLLEKLDESIKGKVTLVSAPAGYGKTTLLCQWLNHHKKPAGWICLDRSDNDVLQFMRYFLAAIQSIEPGIGVTILETMKASDALPGSETWIELINDLSKSEKEFVIILDDYQEVDAQAVHEALIYLIERMPGNLHLILSTRSDPPVYLSRLRTRGQLSEIRQGDLRFSREDATRFLNDMMGLDLTVEDINTLEARTEGWIAALQMAALYLEECDPDPVARSTFIKSFSGTHRFVLDYLVEEVLEQQPTSVQDFLLKTSVLERLCGPLCDAVVDVSEVTPLDFPLKASQAILEHLERSNLFIAPLDNERQWYRYHNLFSDLLHKRLVQTSAHLIPTLHLRACRWYEAQGLISEALFHALAAEDMALVASIVSENVLALVDQAKLIPVIMRISAMPPNVREALPWLEVAYSWALAYTGQIDRAEISLTKAENRLDTLPCDEANRIKGHIATVRAYIAWVNGDQQQAIDYAKEAAGLLPEQQYAVRSLNLTTLGNALTQYEASPYSVEVLEQAVDLARLTRQGHVLMLAMTALAYASSRLGQLHKAHSVCLEAIEVADAHQRQTGQPLPSVAGIYAQLTSVLCEWGEIQPAILAAQKGLALSELWGQADTIVLCLINLINALSLAQEFDSAVKEIQHVRRLVQKISPWFIQTVDHLEVRLWLDMNDIPQAARAASEAIGELPPFILANLLIKQGRLDEALALLESSSRENKEPFTREAIRLAAIQSLAYFIKGDETRALSTLRNTLEFARSENFISTFIREGQWMERLLRLALQKSIYPDFTDHILSRFGEKKMPAPVPGGEHLVETLSEREIEVLRLLATGLSNRGIAAKLVVEASTVSTHTKHIFGKLGVHRRWDAVKRAQELGLI